MRSTGWVRSASVSWSTWCVEGYLSLFELLTQRSNGRPAAERDIGGMEACSTEQTLSPFVHIADELVAVAARINAHRDASARPEDGKDMTVNKREWMVHVGCGSHAVL